jgi:hypothetical protein
MNVTGRIIRSIGNKSDNVFLRAEFEQFGSTSQVGRAINQLESSGQLVKLGLGVYAKARISRLSGKPIPVRPLEELAPEALEKLGVDVGPSRLTRAYNSGQSTQVPVGVVINTGQRRITRQLGFNGASVQYERA